MARGFGYLPLDDGETLTTTRTPDSTSSSAETRSRSAWSMMATSSAESRLTRCFVRRSSRTRPVSSTEFRVHVARARRLGVRVAICVLSIRSRRRNRREKLAAAEHTLDLRTPLVVAELANTRVRRIAGHLLDAEVPLCAARDLRQVRDRDHLRVLGEPHERVGDRMRGLRRRCRRRSRRRSSSRRRRRLRSQARSARAHRPTPSARRARAEAPHSA